MASQIPLWKDRIVVENALKFCKQSYEKKEGKSFDIYCALYINKGLQCPIHCTANLYIWRKNSF